MTEFGPFISNVSVATSRPPLSCRTSPPQGGEIDLWPASRPAEHPGRASALRFRCPFPLPRSNLSGWGASGCRVNQKKSNDTRRRPVRRFLPATSASLRRRPLPGIFHAGPAFHRRTPAHPRQPGLTTMPRHTGAPGALSGPARDLAVQSLHPCPHVARGRPFSADPGERLSRPSSSPGAGPASPQRLVVYPRRNGISLAPVCGGGEDWGGSALILLGNWRWASPSGWRVGRDASRPSPCEGTSA